jgi:hypothetical protein
MELGSGLMDSVGLNRGMAELASGPEVRRGRGRAAVSEPCLSSIDLSEQAKKLIPVAILTRLAAAGAFTETRKNPQAGAS